MLTVLQLLIHSSFDILFVLKLASALSDIIMLKSIFVQLAVAALCALFVAAAPVPDAAADTAAAGASKKKPQDPFTLFFWVKKKPGLSYDEFYKYWEFTHGPKVVKYALKHGFLGYTQVPLPNSPFRSIRD